MSTFYIYSPSYNENSGGAVVLHRLCHLINSIDGCKAFIVPQVPEKISISSIGEFKIDVLTAFKTIIRNMFLSKYFKVNINWNTPVIKKSQIKNFDDAYVVYPEITYGNPLNSPRVIRWLLHQPGHFTNKICYGTNELYFKFNSAVRDFNHSLSCLSDVELKIIYYPLEYYNINNTDNTSGTCHLIRKGSHKKKVHPADSIEIDGMSHSEISRIFKKSKRFISYDDYTAYSIFAVLCGCESIVVPSEGVSKEQWYPKEMDRYGLAYGFSEEELKHANDTRIKVLEHVHREHKRSFDNVKEFVNTVECYFKN